MTRYKIWCDMYENSMRCGGRATAKQQTAFTEQDDNEPTHTKKALVVDVQKHHSTRRGIFGDALRSTNEISARTGVL